MATTPSILLTIDYEPWFALTRRYDDLRDPIRRKKLDGGFTKEALEPILTELDGKEASFYLVGEIADWYPDLPGMIVAAGHELGLHCQYHRPLLNPLELREDLIGSAKWRKQYGVIGYRAPMVGIEESGYRELVANGITYSSSIYAPTGTILVHDGVTEVPVSSMATFGKKGDLTAPRQFTTRLLASGEVPYGSSFMIGLAPGIILRQLEKELKQGLSPVIILHPYEIAPPNRFFQKMLPDLLTSPQLLPFLINKRKFLRQVLSNFPTSSIRSFLEREKTA